MALPRLDLNSLLARLHLNRKKLTTVVEGAVDKRCLTRLVQTQDVTFIEIQDIESPIKDEFHGYGDNKARILSLFQVHDLQKYADHNLLGLVDKDLDGVARPEVKIVGIYYTQYTCLLSFVLNEESLIEMFASLYGFDISGEVAKEIISFGEVFYFLRGYVQKNTIGYGLPPLHKSVRVVSDGGFDWDKYIKIIAQQTGISATTISTELNDSVSKKDAHDTRNNVHFHSLMEYVSLLLLKERFFRRSVLPEDLERLVVGHYLREGRKCPTVALIEAKARNIISC